MASRAEYRVQKRSIDDESPVHWLQNYTPAELICMVWPLTLDAWSFSGELNGESRLQRHVVRTERPKG